MSKAPSEHFKAGFRQNSANRTAKNQNPKITGHLK